jgi:DNA-binding NarL/FixJ family response regulator
LRNFLSGKPYRIKKITSPTIQMEKITILLVDDHKLIRDSWSFILNSDSRFVVIGETSSGEEAIEIAKEKRPRIILMDVNMSPINGFDATKQIHKLSPESKIIAVSMHTMPAYAKRMLQLGAMGYVTKNSSKEEMIGAIVEVNNGKKYICEEVKNILAQQELDEDSEQADMNNLSRRELDIIKLIKDGLSSKEIALQLDISLKTVEVHRYNILKKLKLKNTAALVNFINAKGL